MDVIRQVLGGGGDGGGSGDEEEEEALLAHEGDSSSSSTEAESEEEKECSDAGNKTSFDVSLPAQHLVRRLISVWYSLRVRLCTPCIGMHLSSPVPPPC